MRDDEVSELFFKNIIDVNSPTLGNELSVAARLSGNWKRLRRTCDDDVLDFVSRSSRRRNIYTHTIVMCVIRFNNLTEADVYKDPTVPPPPMIYVRPLVSRSR